MDRALLAGWGKLVSTNAASGVLHLLGFAIAAQALEVAALGVIVLIQAYVRVVDGVFNFQSVNVLTRFLAEADHHGDTGQFRGLVKAGLLVDGITAVLACAIAIAVLPVAGVHVGIPEEWTAPAMLFALVILTRISGVTEAVLRCFDHFWAIGLRGTANGLLLVGGSLAAWWSGAGAGTFLTVWMFAEVAANVGFILWTFVVLRQNGVTGIRGVRALDTIRRAPGFWTMLWQTNVTFGIRMLSQDADLLVAGAVLGSTAAGLLRAAKNIAAIVNQFGRPLQQVASAPIARFAADKQFDALLNYSIRISTYAGSVAFIVAISSLWYGEFVLSILYGESYAGIVIPTMLLLLTSALYLSGIILLPVMVTIDIFTKYFLAIIAGTIVYFSVMLSIISYLGIIGIAIAHVSFNITWLVMSWWCVLRACSIRVRSISN